ncbi:MAG: protein jag [Clostridiales bacterium]|jgi:spoIIIJ-associated protein|nr:protein jag [Clostridiales bacterium]
MSMEQPKGRVIEASAKSVELAVEEALKELNLTRENVEVEVLAAGGLFTKAKVRVSEVLPEKCEAQLFIEKILSLMGIKIETTMGEDDGEQVVQMEGEELGPVIGHRGEIIDSLQYIMTMSLGRDNPEYKRVLVDAQGYRARKRERLESIAVNMAAKAVRLGNRVKLEPMSSYERRIIHGVLTGNEEVTTRSEGEEPYRYIVIEPKLYKSFTNREGFEPTDKRFHQGRPGGERPAGGGYNRDRGGYGDRPSREGGYNRDRGGNGGGYNRDRAPYGDRPPRDPNAPGYVPRPPRDTNAPGYVPRPPRDPNAPGYGDRPPREGGYNRDRGGNGGGYNRDRGGYGNRDGGRDRGYGDRSPRAPHQNPYSEFTTPGAPAAPRKTDFTTGKLIGRNPNPYSDPEDKN